MIVANCAEHFNIDLGQHHNALDDAITCAKIVLCCLRESGLPNIGALCFAHENVKINTFSGIAESNTFKTYKKADVHSRKAPSYASIRIKDIVPVNSTFDETHPLYQKYIVFTGDITIGRREAMQFAVNVGAILKDDISKKVDYLVVGSVQPEFKGKDGLSGKELRAIDLNATGKADIKIIGEADFIALLGREALV